MRLKRLWRSFSCSNASKCSSPCIERFRIPIYADFDFSNPQSSVRRMPCILFAVIYVMLRHGRSCLAPPASHPRSCVLRAGYPSLRAETLAPVQLEPFASHDRVCLSLTSRYHLLMYLDSLLGILVPTIFFAALDRGSVAVGSGDQSGLPASFVPLVSDSVRSDILRMSRGISIMLILM